MEFLSKSRLSTRKLIALLELANRDLVYHIKIICDLHKNPLFSLPGCYGIHILHHKNKVFLSLAFVEQSIDPSLIQRGAASMKLNT